MAAALLQHYAKEAGLKVRAASVGLAAFPGDTASEKAIEAMRELGVDLTSHRSRRFHPAMADEFDVILVMTESHKRQLLQMAPELAGRVFLLQDYSHAVQSGQEAGSREEKVYDIADPFGQSLEVYRQVRDELAEAIRAIVTAWQKEEEVQK